jgi:hypothetical protein
MEIKEIVKEKYGYAALRVTTGGSSCCGARASLDGSGVDPITSSLYDAIQTGQIPEEAVLASLGCGNPTALAKLNAGEVVLDLGSGGGMPEQVRRGMEMWVGCIAGALHDHEYIGKLAKAGFDAIDIEPTPVYSIEDGRQFLTAEGIDVDAMASQVENKFMSAFIRAVKPTPKECCGPSCCS